MMCPYDDNNNHDRNHPNHRRRSRRQVASLSPLAIQLLPLAHVTSRTLVQLTKYQMSSTGPEA